jgi:hypothetical protein
MSDLARGFPDDGRLPPPEAAQATYKAMNPEDRALVDMHAARLKTKGDPRYRTRALAIVQGLNADVGSDDSPEVPDTEPTTGEAIGAGIMGAGRAGLDIIGAQRVSKAKPEDDNSLAGRTEASMNEAAATAPGAFGTGHGVMDALTALAAGGTAAKRIAKEGLSTSGPRAALHRLLGAGRELVTESVEGGGTPTARGAVARGVRALLGAGGEVKPSQIIDETSVAPRPQPPPIPSVATPLAELGPRPAPPLAKAPLPADVPVAPPDSPPEPPPDPRERALADLVEPADMPADVMAAEAPLKPTPPAAPGQRLPTITGSGEQLVAYVKRLPSSQRVAWIHRLAGDMGKDTAAAVAKAAGVSLKLDPL